MFTTRFTELVGCSIPIQQAAIGGLSTPALAAAVAQAGGMGMVCMYWSPPGVIENVLDDLREQTSGIFGTSSQPPSVMPELRPAWMASSTTERLKSLRSLPAGTVTRTER